MPKYLWRTYKKQVYMIAEYEGERLLVIGCCDRGVCTAVPDGVETKNYYRHNNVKIIDVEDFRANAIIIQRDEEKIAKRIKQGKMVM